MGVGQTSPNFSLSLPYIPSSQNKNYWELGLYKNHYIYKNNIISFYLKQNVFFNVFSIPVHVRSAAVESVKSNLFRCVL